MNGIDFVADTNFLIAVHEGKKLAKPFLDNAFAVSCITEIELLGYPRITEADKRKLKSLLHSCEIIELKAEIKEIAIGLRQKQAVKVPDAIIAATGLFLGVPIITSDKGFKNIRDIEVILLT